MKVLVVGGGGREHALAWKISQSPRVKKVYCAPGNAGTQSLAENVDIRAEDIQALKKFATQEKIDFTVVGPEAPLTEGIVDEFEQVGLKCFGPYKIAAELEGSKVFAKQFMDRHKIPTGQYRIVDTPKAAQQILQSGVFSFPVVVKADGLAAGKGVILCRSLRAAEEAVDSMIVEKKFGDAGKIVVIEEFLRGDEASFIVVSDGLKVMPFVTNMDHKAVFDGDKGPNTGGMGAISPNPFVKQDLFNHIMKTIVLPTVTRMLEEERKYKGVLYVGLMLTEQGPKVLEYNCRFGDPETQPQMLRLESDLMDILEAAMEGNVLSVKPKWNRKASGCVVLASGGYPTKYEKGKQIEGLDRVAKMKDVVVFHAGTREEKGKILTAGGRVLNVCASLDTLEDTMKIIYDAVDELKFEAMHYRKDIGIERKV
ncbi:MAG: phosphoribosylamine--glycine ligase [Candidatus Aminicenantaceae bacterium]